MKRVWSQTLFVGNLAPSVSEAMLIDIFAHYGQIINFNYFLEKHHAFVTFERRSEAELGAKVAGLVLEGRELKIGWAKGFGVSETQFNYDTGESVVPIGATSKWRPNNQKYPNLALTKPGQQSAYLSARSEGSNGGGFGLGRGGFDPSRGRGGRGGGFGRGRGGGGPPDFGGGSSSDYAVPTSQSYGQGQGQGQGQSYGQGQGFDRRDSHSYGNASSSYNVIDGGQSDSGDSYGGYNRNAKRKFDQMDPFDSKFEKRDQFDHKFDQLPHHSGPSGRGGPPGGGDAYGGHSDSYGGYSSSYGGQSSSYGDHSGQFGEKRPKFDDHGPSKRGPGRPSGWDQPSDQNSSSGGSSSGGKSGGSDFVAYPSGPSHSSGWDQPPAH